MNSNRNMKLKLALIAILIMSMSLLLINCTDEAPEYEAETIAEVDMTQLMAKLAQYEGLSGLVATFEAPIRLEDNRQVGIVTKIVLYGDYARGSVYTDQGVMMMRADGRWERDISEFTTFFDVGDIILLPEGFENDDKVKIKKVTMLKKYYESPLGR